MEEMQGGMEFYNDNGFVVSLFFKKDILRDGNRTIHVFEQLRIG